MTQQTTWTTLGLLQRTAAYLQERELEAPRLAAERLLAHVLGCRRVDLYLQGEREIAERELVPYRSLVRDFASGRPLQYVIGETEFMGLGFKIDARALIPRPETELLVDAVRKRLPSGGAGGNLQVLEMGVGCGAIAVSLARARADVEVWATEIDPHTAALAGENAQRLGVADRVHVIATNHFDALAPDLHERFECIVANPPYVSRTELETLPPLVRQHEPLRALDGGADGLDAHRFLCGDGLQFLARGGTLAVEIGSTQGGRVSELFADAGLARVQVVPDYAGRDRVVVGQRA
jgi:release factor glutamine methyltransferase